MTCPIAFKAFTGKLPHKLLKCSHSLAPPNQTQNKYLLEVDSCEGGPHQTHTLKYSSFGVKAMQLWHVHNADTSHMQQTGPATLTSKRYPLQKH